MKSCKQIGLTMALVQLVSAQTPCKQPASADCVEPYLDSEANGYPEWEAWKAKFNKRYESDEEEVLRRTIWTERTAHMITENAEPGRTFSMGWHSRTDWTEDEYRRIKGRANGTRTTRLGVHRGKFHLEGKASDLPYEVDWSYVPEVVTYVKDQLYCGSCYAFSSAAGLEGALGVAIGWTTSLSAQQLLDCEPYGNCDDGGWEPDVYDWARDNFVCDWDGYPYTGKDGNCNWNCNQIINPGSIWGHYEVGQDEGSLCAAVLQRPISVGVACGDDDSPFMNYAGGVVSYNEKQNYQDHAVLLVGYGYTEDGNAYWKIKNSWGQDWGLGGYILLDRNPGTNQNCIYCDASNGVYVYGPYNPELILTDSKGNRIKAPKSATVV